MQNNTERHQMKTSAAGKALIDRNEGDKLVAYLDRIADPPVWTIGRGCTGPEIYEGLEITQAESDRMFDGRLAREFEPGVMAAIGDSPTTQAQFDAMISLAWNIGIGGFARSSVARLHKAGDYMAAASAFALWNKSGGKVIDGLVRRRKEEADLYLSGGTGLAPAPSPEPAPSSPISHDYLLVLQAFMRASGDYIGEIDGIDGPLTWAAVDAVRQRTTQ